MPKASFNPLLWLPCCSASPPLPPPLNLWRVLLARHLCSKSWGLGQALLILVRALPVLYHHPHNTSARPSYPDIPQTNPPPCGVSTNTQADSSTRAQITVTEVLVTDVSSAPVCALLDLHTFCSANARVLSSVCACLMTAAGKYSVLCSLCKGVDLSLVRNQTEFSSTPCAVPSCSPRHVALRMRS